MIRAGKRYILLTTGIAGFTSWQNCVARLKAWTSLRCGQGLTLISKPLNFKKAAPRAGASIGPRLVRYLPLDRCIYESLPGMHLNTSISSIMRSEEHTSELQSLMRISYAVFCLKKKKTKKR